MDRNQQRWQQRKEGKGRKGSWEEEKEEEEENQKAEQKSTEIKGGVNKAW